MSLDLYQRESAERVGNMPLVQDAEPGAFDNFWRGAGLYTMRGLARAGRSIDLLGSVGPVIQDAFTGGTVAQDRYYREHDEIWGSAVDYWTPRANEVGVAGEVVGQLASMLPLIFASPAFAVGEAQLGTAEDLLRKGVGAGSAQAVGGVQAAGLGLGIWVPILGQNLWQRMVVGGAGFNVAQGVVTRAASSEILAGSPEAKMFEAFDGTALTIDVLLGLAFGGWAHLNPEMRAQGKGAWERIQRWAEGATPSQIAALATLRQAQHLNVDSTPGKPATAHDVEAHVERAKRAIEQVVRGQPVDVEDLPAGTYKPDPARLSEMRSRAEELVAEGERVRKAEDLPAPPEPDMVAARAEGNLEALDPADQARTIGQTIRQQLETTGMPLEEAQANATLWESFFRTAGERYGVAPAELMKQYGVDVKRLRGDASLVGALDQAATTKEERTFFQQVGKGKKPAQVFYSELERQVTAAKMNQAPAKGWKDLLKSFAQRGVKADELKWSGIEEWLDLQQGKVTKEQVIAFLKENGVRVSEVKRGGPGGNKTLMDQAIARDVNMLREEEAIEPRVNPEDESVVAFEDDQGDFITADDIRDRASELRETDPEMSQRLNRAADAARRIENYWAEGGESEPMTRTQLEQTLRSRGWEYQIARPEELDIRRATGGVRGEVREWINVTDGTAGADPRVPDNVLEIAERLEAVLIQGANASAKPTKFGQYQLPGGKNYTELVLTLPQDPDNLPKGYRIQELAKPSDEPAGLDALTDEWQKWQRDHEYPPQSADEWLSMAHASHLEGEEWPNKREEIEYAEQFIERWEAAQEADNRRFRYTLIGPDNVGHALAANNIDEARDAAMRYLDSTGVLDKLQFRESHWDEPNVLAHVRFNERTDADGKKVLFIEEIQSDWAQKGKKKGFAVAPGPRPTALPEGAKVVRSFNPEQQRDAGHAAYEGQDESDAMTYRHELITEVGVKPEDIIVEPLPGYRDAYAVYTALYAVTDPSGRNDFLEPGGSSHQAYSAKGAEESAIRGLQREWERRVQRGSIPAGPFVGKTESWVGLVMKRMIREAAERGFDRIGWTTGEQQTSRYTSALRKAVDEIHWTKTEKGVQLQGYKGKGPAKKPPPEVIEQLELNVVYAEDEMLRRRNAMLAALGGPRAALGGDPKLIIPSAAQWQDYKRQGWTVEPIHRDTYDVRDPSGRSFTQVTGASEGEAFERFARKKEADLLRNRGIDLQPGERAYLYDMGYILEMPDGKYRVDVPGDEGMFDNLQAAEKYLWDEFVSSEHVNNLPNIPERAQLQDAQSEYYEARDELRRAKNPPADKGTKVVDTTEKEDALSDAIGKAMADQILNDPNPSGVISGAGIVVADTGMAQFYDRIVPNVAKDILKKLGGGQVGKTKIAAGDDKLVVKPYRTDDVPDFSPMRIEDRETYGGAEDFGDGEPPLFGEARLSLNGSFQDVYITIGPDGVHVLDPQGRFELYADAEDLAGGTRPGRAHTMWRTQDGALNAFIHNWETAELFDSRLQLINGEIPGPKAQTEQLAFDITPEVKKRALEGLPLFQAGAKGQIKFGEGETIIGLLENADRSTFLHETGHFFLQVTRDLSTKAGAPEGAKQDWETIQEWLGIKGKGEIPVEAHEKFARGFEGYLMTGQAPSAGLKAAFERFRDWLISIYESIAALEVELSKDVLGVFDRMLALKQDPAQPGVPRPAIEDTPAARKTVQGYVEKLEAGEPIEPVLVDRTNPARVVDGNHRLQAHMEAGVPPDIVAVPAEEAIVKMGTENWSPLRVAEELGRPLEAEAPAATRGGTEPPPPRGSRPGEAAGAEARTAEPRTLDDPKIRELVQHMAQKESGWEQMGGRLDTGRLLRDTGQKLDPRVQGGGVKLGTPAFTTWIPKAEWWTGRPDKKMNERLVKEAVAKAIAGQPLKKAESRTVDYMVQVANERAAAEADIGAAEFDAIVRDMGVGRELEPTVENIVDADLVAQAREIDEAAVERAAIQYENDDQGFMAQVRRVLEQASANRRAAVDRQEGGGEAPDAGGGVPGEKESGAGEGQPAGEGEGPDAITREAERFVLENPDRLITLGSGPNGEPMQVTAREYLESARAEASQAREDAALFEVAAQCLLGGGSA